MSVRRTMFVFTEIMGEIERGNLDALTTLEAVQAVLTNAYGDVSARDAGGLAEEVVNTYFDARNEL